MQNRNVYQNWKEIKLKFIRLDINRDSQYIISYYIISYYIILYYIIDIINILSVDDNIMN